MPCCPTCACIGEPFDCLAALYPEQWGHLRAFCQSDDPVRRMHARDRSEIGWTPPTPHETPPDQMPPRRPAPAPQPATGEPRPAPAPPSGGPSLARKAVSFGKALIQHAVEGFPKADDATAEARMEICKSCPSFDAEKSKCLSCGCQLNVKIYWSEQECPLGKW